MTQFILNGRELSFQEVVQCLQDAAPADTSDEEKGSYNWLAKAASDGDLGAQTFLNKLGIKCAGRDGTSIWLPDGTEVQS
jgi:hypothetical protein